MTLSIIGRLKSSLPCYPSWFWLGLNPACVHFTWPKQTGTTSPFLQDNIFNGRTYYTCCFQQWYWELCIYKWYWEPCFHKWYYSINTYVIPKNKLAVLHQHRIKQPCCWWLARKSCTNIDGECTLPGPLCPQKGRVSSFMLVGGTASDVW